MTTKIPVELSSTPSIVDNGDATAITIDSSENVGIGETSPASKLHISATGEARLIVEGDSNNDAGEESALIEFRTDGGAVRHRIEATGSGGNDLKITAGADQTTNTLNSEIIFETKTANSSAAERMRIDADGNVGIGVSSVVRQPLQVHRASTSDVQIHMTNSATGSTASDGMTIFSNSTTSGFWQRESAKMLFATANTERLNIDTGGNINKYISGYSATSLTIADNSVNGVGGTNNTGGLLVMKRDTGNLRSISAAGTINASGADYAEYMTKSDGCGDIAKGDVVGVDVNGKLTKIFSDAISFVIKSTDPSYVGGDNWLTENQSNPDHEDYINPKSEEYNTARASVDRIAFCGQVPVNITGSFNVGDYVYPQANGTDIEAVAKSNPTFEEYQLCVGKIWAIQEDGRPFVSVKIN